MSGVTEEITVQFDDLDAMGMVHNAKYALLLERAMSAYWARQGWPYDPGSPEFAKAAFAVKEFTISYHVPITRTGPVQVRFWLERLGGSSIVYGFHLLSADGAVLHADGRRVQVRINLATGRPVPLSPELRAAAAPLLAPSPAPSPASTQAPSPAAAPALPMLPSSNPGRTRAQPATRGCYSGETSRLRWHHRGKQ